MTPTEKQPADMSDTPRTDDEISLASDPDGAREVCDLCRALERELNEAKKAIENAKAYKRIMKEDNARMRAEIKGWENKWQSAVEMAARSNLDAVQSGSN